ncbi:hypothetical protein M9H77_01396 [Catharanthus roseus]|uniref:Uncharacterized protein n=1 Tax=Catharanthus roseus TaxID=4058 RepID=A0ACC0C5K2_CATRO|nr:hypothetical protein M9H77_01396 [Catharanthus roseus]
MPMQQSTIFPYGQYFQSFIVPYMDDWVDVVSDGNGGFRVIAHFIHGDQNRWPDIRHSLWLELRWRWEMYRPIMGTRERQDEVMQSLEHWGPGGCGSRHWMLVPETLFLIANAFNVCVALISKTGPLTVLPLDLQNNRGKNVIAIGHLKSIEHFIAMASRYLLCIHRGEALESRLKNWVEYQSNSTSQSND